MRKTKKQLLGFVCLAAVAVMTAIAISLPVPDAAAADEEQASAESGAEVQVYVLPEEGRPTARFTNINNNDVWTEPNKTIKIAHSGTTELKISATYKIGEQEKTEEVKTIATPDKDGVASFDYNFPAGAESVTMKVTPYYNGLPGTDDYVSFSYRAMATSMGAVNTENNNPTVKFRANSQVNSIEAFVYNLKGESVFIDKEQGDVPIIIDWSSRNAETGLVNITLPDGTKTTAKYDAKTGEATIELPMDKAKASKGTYTLVARAYGKNGDYISMNEERFDYDPKAPKLPDTGSVFGGLNITKADYLVTGLIAFGLAAGFALVLIFRRNHRK